MRALTTVYITRYTAYHKGSESSPIAIPAPTLSTIIP